MSYLFKGIQRYGQVTHGTQFHGLMCSYNDYQQVLFISYRGVVKVMIVHGMSHLGTLQRMLVIEKT